MASEPANIGQLPVKRVFTTGEAAAICGVSQQTIIRLFDAGKIEGYRVPASRFRRIPYEGLVRFMKEYGVPLDRLATGKRKVLVVDDDLAIIEMLVELLERDGRFEVRTAMTGFDAGLKTKEFSPDVIVLDFMLPDINGNAVCRSIRSDATLRHVKVIIVSGVVSPDEVDRLMECGADDFFQKPFSIEQLVDRIMDLACEPRA